MTARRTRTTKPAARRQRLPVAVLTGFLGAGKTSLLRRLLAAEAAGRTAVLVNEFGEVGIDQLLVSPIAPDIVLLESGCICCRIRGELKDALVDLLDARAEGRLPPFERIVIETTGLAEPGPIHSTLAADPLLANQVVLERVVAVIDAGNAQETHGRRPEWLAQVAAADIIALAKTDLATAAQAGALRALLAQLNPGAALVETAELDGPAVAALFDRPVDRTAGLLPAAPAPKRHRARDHDHGHDHAHEHEHGAVTSFTLVLDRKLDWTAFGVWLSALLHWHGDRILRVKGILDTGTTGGEGERPLLLNGVQHTIHPPEHLPAWPGSDRRSRLVFITDGLERATVERSLAAWLAAATGPKRARSA
ncbi:CobW family GTP-binding protein [Marinibaculum pumilum]|uniref:CobW family GTP-binding protein n=1 Tax=Marinibaculum pumilum TaxID=1766165 RepID=A0ABV7L7P5_9PROT